MKIDGIIHDDTNDVVLSTPAYYGLWAEIRVIERRQEGPMAQVCRSCKRRHFCKSVQPEAGIAGLIFICPISPEYQNETQRRMRKHESGKKDIKECDAFGD